MTERLAVFVDGSNLYHSLKERFGGGRIRIKRFARKLAASYDMVAFLYYDVPLDEPTDPAKYAGQRRFFASVEEIPNGKVILGKMYWRRGKWVEKGVDVNIAVDLVRMAIRDEFDIAILVSGDGDLAGAVRIVQELGKKVHVAGFDHRMSRNLAAAATGYIQWNDKFFEDLIIA